MTKQCQSELTMLPRHSLGICCEKRAHMQLVRECSFTVISACWAILVWSWPKEWNWCIQLELLSIHTHTPKKVRAGNDSSNLSPKSVHVRNKPPPPPCCLGWLCCLGRMLEHVREMSRCSSSGNASPQLSQLAEPLCTDPYLNSGISVHELICLKKKKRCMQETMCQTFPLKSSHVWRKPPLLT